MLAYLITTMVMFIISAVVTLMEVDDSDRTPGRTLSSILFGLGMAAWAIWLLCGRA